MIKTFKVHVTHTIRVILRRIKWSLQWKSIIKWGHETCYDCGSNYRWYYHLDYDRWMEIVGDSNICLCLDCLGHRAVKNNFKLKINDFILKPRLIIREEDNFNPYGKHNEHHP